VVEEALFKDGILEDYEAGYAENTADEAQDRVDY